MKNWWIRFGCFLTGYNYHIVQSSSEVAAASVKKYTSAMLIVCILWAFVGYTFTQRYLEGSLFGCIAGAVIAVIIIVQIERQIILSVSPSKGLYIFRGLLALMMSLLGAVIIDQIILKQDIELEKISYIGQRVDKLLPSKTAELKGQILALDTSIQVKETERQALIDDVTRMPLIKNVTSQTQSVPVVTTEIDTLGKSSQKIVMKPSTNIVVSNSPNPKQALIAPLDAVIAEMRKQKITKENALLNIRPALEKEISSKIGFLDELKVMFSLISNSTVALCFWLLWILFILFLELLVLFSKIGDKKNDYDKTLHHQMEHQIKRLEVLSRQ